MVIPGLSLPAPAPARPLWLSWRPSAAYNDGMDYNPRAESVRLLAMAAYVPPVAFGLLLSKRHRDIRLIRFHAYQAIGLILALVLALVLGSLVASLFGSLPAIGLLIDMAVGLAIAVALIAATAVAFYGAAMAYQGNYTSVPLLTDWVWLQVNGSGRAKPPAKRKRKRRPRPPAPTGELSWEVPAAPEEEEAP